MLAAGLNSRRGRRRRGGRKKKARKQSSAAFSVGRLEREREGEMKRVGWVRRLVRGFYPGEESHRFHPPRPARPQTHTHTYALAQTLVCVRTNTQTRLHFACPFPSPILLLLHLLLFLRTTMETELGIQMSVLCGGMSVPDWKLFPAAAPGLNQSFCTYSSH